MKIEDITGEYFDKLYYFDRKDEINEAKIPQQIIRERIHTSRTMEEKKRLLDPH